MNIEFMEAAKGTHDPFETMISWCERAESKAILGATLTTEVRSTGGNRALGEVHQEVMWELVISDARQVQGTLTRDLVYPLAVLNLGAIEAPARSPRFVFDTQEAEDLSLYADALPKLVDVGFTIPLSWAREKLQIPEPEGDEPVLMRSAPSKKEDKEITDAQVAAARAERYDPQQALKDGATALSGHWQETIGPVLDDLLAMLEETQDINLFRERLIELIGREPPPHLVESLTRAGFAANLLGQI